MTWPTKALSELVTRIDTSGPDPARAEFAYVDLSAVDSLSKTIAQKKTLSLEQAPSRARQHLATGDVLVSTVRPNLNSVAQVQNAYDGAIASTGFCVLRPHADKLCGRFLFHWTRTSDFIGDMTRLATGASYPAVSDAIVKASVIPLPPLPEQRRIAAILDQADELRTKRRRALELLDELADSLFIDLFGDIAKGDLRWPMGRVDDFGKVQLGRQRAPKYQTGQFTFPYLRVANVYEDRLKLTNVLSMDFDRSDFPKYKLLPGDVLLNEGQSTELVGRPAMWRGEIPNCCFQNTLLRFSAKAEVALPDFALGVFLRYYRAGMFSQISSKTSSVAHLGSARFAAMKFPRASMTTQMIFSSRIRELDLLKANARSSFEAADELFASLQHRAFRGEL